MSEWISVKDRLPEFQASVLIFTGKSYRVCSLSSSGWSLSGSFHEVDYPDDDWDWDLTFIANVTHWMPLPEAPKD